MKIAIFNISGNVGKSTLARHLIKPNLPGSKWVLIENINAGDGTPDVQIDSDDFPKFAAEIATADPKLHFVVDLGASVSKAMITQLDTLRSARNRFDYWIVPVVQLAAGNKELQDSIQAVSELIRIGVRQERIVVIGNNVTSVKTFDNDFQVIKEHANNLGASFCSQAVLHSDAYPGQRHHALDVISYAESDIDFDALIQGAKNDDDRLEYALQQNQHDLCDMAAKNLRAVWKSTPMAAALKATDAAAQNAPVAVGKSTNKVA